MTRQSGRVETEDRSVPQVFLGRRASSCDAPRPKVPLFTGKTFLLQHSRPLRYDDRVKLNGEIRHSDELREGQHELWNHATIFNGR